MKTKIFLFFSLVFACSQLFAQTKSIPVVKANSEKTYFQEGDNLFRNYWWLDASVELDEYVTNKMTLSKEIHFHTDIDSLTIKLAPGESFDFLVLLGEQDSCYTRVSSPKKITKYQSIIPAIHDTIPFELTAFNNLKIKALVNGKDSIDLFFDTGNTDLNIQHEFIYDKTKLLENYPINYTLEDGVPLEDYANLTIGSTIVDSLIVYPTSFTAHKTDGSIGWNVFDGRIVEINYDSSFLIIHSSLGDEFEAENTIVLDMDYDNTLFFVKGDVISSGTAYVNRFLFDLGYQKSLLLDKSLLEQQGYPVASLEPSKKESAFISETGDLLSTVDVYVDTLAMGGKQFRNISAQIFGGERPIGFPTHVVGTEFLKQFNTVLDFQNSKVYLVMRSENKLDFVLKEQDK